MRSIWFYQTWLHINETIYIKSSRSGTSAGVWGPSNRASPDAEAAFGEEFTGSGEDNRELGQRVRTIERSMRFRAQSIYWSKPIQAMSPITLCTICDICPFLYPNHHIREGIEVTKIGKIRLLDWSPAPGQSSAKYSWARWDLLSSHAPVLELFVLAPLP